MSPVIGRWRGSLYLPTHEATAMKLRFIVMALVAFGQLGCADNLQMPSLDEAPREAQEVGALVDDFFEQAEAELRVTPERRGEAIKGHAVVTLGAVELHLEVIPRGPDTQLAEALRAGTTIARLNPLFLDDFQGARSREVGVLAREEVGAYLLDHERQPVCGDRMLGVIAELSLDEHHTEEALLWLHLRHAHVDARLPGEAALGWAEASASEMTTLMSKEGAALQYIDCGDDWSVWGTPDCNTGPCIKNCRVKLSETKTKGLGVIGGGMFALPVPVYWTDKQWGFLKVGGTCGVDDGWTYNSCACIAECPDD